MKRLLLGFLLILVVAPVVSGQRGRIIRQTIYRRDRVKFDPRSDSSSGVLPWYCSPVKGCPPPATQDSIVAREAQHDYDMLTRFATECLVKMGQKRANMGREAMPNFVPYGAQLTNATALAKTIHTECERWMSVQKDTTRVPPYVPPTTVMPRKPTKATPAPKKTPAKPTKKP